MPVEELTTDDDGMMVTKLPYMKRRVIVVSNKAVLEAAEEARKRENAPLKSDSDSTQTLFNAAIKLAASMMGWEYSLGRVLVSTAVEAYRAVTSAQAKGVPILPITFEQSEALHFPPGHPREGVVYVCHPAKRDTYYTMGDFHRMAFEHKFAEAMTMLMSLGATTIDVVHVSGWSRELMGKFSGAVPTQTGPTKLGAELKHGASSDNAMLFKAQLSSSHTPRLPTNLSWYQHEPTWQSIADGRLNCGLSSFCLTVNYNDDFGIDGKLGAKVKEVGLEVGGKFEDHKATVWRIEGTFAPISAPNSYQKSEA